MAMDMHLLHVCLRFFPTQKVGKQETSSNTATKQKKGFISTHVNQLGWNMRAGVSHCRFVCSLSSVYSQRWAGAGNAASYIQTMTGQTVLPHPRYAADCRRSPE